jgi:hypothetical protein
MLELLIVSAVVGFVIGGIANSRGLPFGTWWLYGTLLWPAALVHVFFATPGSVTVSRRVGRVCPHCAESVRDEARVCKHCGRDLGMKPGPAPGAMTRADLQFKPHITVERLQ